MIKVYHWGSRQGSSSWRAALFPSANLTVCELAPFPCLYVDKNSLKINAFLYSSAAYEAQSASLKSVMTQDCTKEDMHNLYDGAKLWGHMLGDMCRPPNIASKYFKSLNYSLTKIHTTMTLLWLSILSPLFEEVSSIKEILILSLHRCNFCRIMWRDICLLLWWDIFLVFLYRHARKGEVQHDL